jgi:hypothetical protein
MMISKTSRANRSISAKSAIGDQIAGKTGLLGHIINIKIIDPQIKYEASCTSDTSRPINTSTTIRYKLCAYYTLFFG